MATTTRRSRSRMAVGTQAKRRQARARKRRKRTVLYTGLAVIMASGLAAFLLWAVFAPQPGEHVPSQGNTHITEAQMGQSRYNTSPPTSGPHLGSLARWGAHDEPIPDELQVHNLEDGGVIVQYNCPDGCPDLVIQLQGIVEDYHKGVILAPYPDMESRIALTAWQRIDQLDQFDEERISRFVRAYQGDDHHQ